MKVIIFLALLVAVAFAASQGADKQAQVVKHDSDNLGVDGYKWSYETSNGIAAEETGQLLNAGSDKEAMTVRGSFRYIGDDGVTYAVTYIADENGFQPVGAHIPVAIKLSNKIGPVQFNH